MNESIILPQNSITFHIWYEFFINKEDMYLGLIFHSEISGKLFLTGGLECSPLGESVDLSRQKVAWPARAKGA